jgi:hypothetical protein
MSLEEATTALAGLAASNATPELKEAGYRALVEMLKAGSTLASGNVAEHLADQRASRVLKHALGWLIVGGAGIMFATAFGHAVGLWTIKRPEQLPWMWGSAIGMTVGGAGYLLKFFFPKGKGS